ncbi:MAG: hypothetical protein HXY43_16930 [Fischerella sp.]|jgi:hypothetical protein|uniref:hypothetical protein n=1 Tax=Fischerella sp. TaxID=1191 RepID=UPI0017A403B4|nr:hypothetical protein [Fischerella sp.]NWF60890.1 hypothetical protein [Fischerella sp.]
MGRNWAIFVGINNYNNLQQLKCAKRDAEAMVTWFQEGEEIRRDKGQAEYFTETLGKGVTLLTAILSSIKNTR